MLRLFKKRGQAVKKWRSKAWSIDPKKTNLIIVVEEAKLTQHVPPSIYKKWLLSQIT